MVEFINRVTESQASDKVHKILRADPDKKRGQSEREKSDAEKNEEAPKVADEILLSEEADIKAEIAIPEPVDETKVKNKELGKKENENPSGHIDVTA